jgi:heme-degrading monooxygenase HmoA
MQQFHLAQINIATAKAAMDSVIMKGFIDRLDEINQLADKSPGFIWRLKSEEGTATITGFEDPSIIVNMSVWEDLDSLKNYVYKSVHLQLLKEKNTWFNKMSDAHQVLWWVPSSHIPSISEGEEKLKYIREHGVTDVAFNFAKNFPSPASL